MIFNSLTYLLLLTSVIGLYWVLPYRARLLLIFSASLIFYGFWRIEFIPVMLLSVVADYWISLGIQGKTKRHRKILLSISLSINLGLLLYFKYLIFFAENAIGLVNFFGGNIDPIFLNIILPLGISFYTFQTISYTVDVYRGHIKPERDFLLYACYVIFFPQLIAGPILRATEVINQFIKPIQFNWDLIFCGLRRVLYGLFLKVVLADNIAPLVDHGYAMPLSAISSIDVWTLAFLFGLQIYFDFSAYSHIAIGSARMMGIYFPENFNFPYMASSPKDFWRRWHISLGSWIRDYLYLPLVGVKVHDRSTGGLATATENRKHIRPLFFTWAIMGLWHGANWNFLIWGLYHAVVILLYRWISPSVSGVRTKLQWWIGFIFTLPIIMLGWIPFRAESVSSTLSMWGKLFQPAGYLWLGMRENVYLITAILFFSVFATFFFQEKILPKLKKSPLIVFFTDTILIAIMVASVIVFLRPINQFIYFQF